jgi:dihydrofolate reductase
MRKIYASAFLSLDGVMQAPGGPGEDDDDGFAFGGWTFHHWDDVMGEVMDKAFARDFDLLLGRRTYDIFAGHWTRVPEDDPVALKFNPATKYVATSRPETLGWANSVAITGDIAGGIAEIKNDDGKDILVQGSSQLMQVLLAHGLLDELTLWIFPVVLGSGKKLFGAGTVPVEMKLIESHVATSGVIVATYVRNGAVRTGSFALPDESPS